MHRKSKFIAILLVLGSIIIVTEPVYADDNHAELMNVSLITDLNQTIGKDALNLVDESRLDIRGSPHMSFSWCPDGTRVLIYADIKVNTKGKVSSNTDTWGDVLALYMINADGSGIRRISWGEVTPYTVQRGEHKLIGSPAWSPTGEVFLYTERSGGNARFGGGSHSLSVVDAKNLDLIAKKSLPAKEGPILEWSPEEDSLLYLGLDEQYKLTVFLLNITKNVSEELPITKYKKTHFGNNDLFWSPDGRKIGFEGNGGLFILDIDTREVKNLFSTDNHIIINRNAFWSPDSSRLIITEIKSTGRADSPIYDVYVIDAINGTSNKLTSFESGAIQRWFPGSDRILYVAASKAGTDSKEYTLYSMPVEDGDATPLFSSPDDPTSFFAHISPSGKFIGVMFSGADYLMNKDGSSKMQLNINKGAIIWHGRDE
ncbi:MAG: PD40 domain-containing protein, partial [Methanosarcinales archaeon]|nr:PD40 domain-containing protein [Methanosarcinales archaeon]